MDPVSLGFSRRILNNDRIITDLARKLTERKYSKEQNARADKELVDLIGVYRAQVLKMMAVNKTEELDEAFLSEKRATEGGLTRGKEGRGEGVSRRTGGSTATDPGEERSAEGSEPLLR
jgi:hypothetical protein